jgi:anti-sigma factor RsiW
MTDLAFALRLLEREERLRPDAGWHPSPEELTAYRDGRLSARRAARVCRHLGVCFDCPDLLLELERFLEPVPDDAGTIDTEASWQELRRRLFAQPRPRPPDALAAVSLLAVVALSFWSGATEEVTLRILHL